MIKSKRLISFMCSCAIAASAFTGVIVANAETTSEVTQGIVLKYDEANSTSQKAVIIAEAVGVATIDAWQVNLVPVDSNVVIESATVDGGDSPFDVQGNVTSSHVYKVVGNGNTAQVVEDNPVLATFTLNFENPLNADTSVKLDVGSSLEANDAEGNAVDMFLDGLDTDTLATTTVEILANPSSTPSTTEPSTTEPVATTEPAVSESPTATVTPTETPYVIDRPTARPTATPVATEEPIETAAPVTQGIELTYDRENSTANKVVIIAKAVGVATIDAWQVNLTPEDANVKITSATVDGGDSPFDVQGNVTASNVYKVVGNGNTAQVVADNDILATFTLNFDTALTSNTKFVLDVGSSLEANDAEGNAVDMFLDGLETDTLRSTFVVALANPNPEQTESPEPTESPAPFEGGEIALGDLVTNAPASDETYGILVALDVKVTKNNGDEAVYGDGFVAVYDDKELTEDEYFNLINGYGGVSIADVISGL